MIENEFGENSFRNLSIKNEYSIDFPQLGFPDTHRKLNNADFN
jgi:hypothetical protein